MKPTTTAVTNKTLEQSSDAELFALIKNHETNPTDANQAWNVFYRRYSSYLWKYCRHLCRSDMEGEELAKDIFQSTMAKIYQKADKFKAEKNTGTKAWISIIARNHYIDFYKKYTLRSVYANEEYNDLPEPVNDDCTSDISELGKEALLNILSILSPKEYHILMTYMSYYQPENPSAHLPDLEMEKLCKEYDIKSDAVRQTKKRALDKLKAKLKNST